MPIIRKNRNLTPERKRSILIARYGYKEDELDVLLRSSTIDELFAAASTKASDADYEDSIDIEPPEAELARVEHRELAIKSRKQQRKQSAFPEEAQVSEEETMATQRSLSDILKEIEQDDDTEASELSDSSPPEDKRTFGDEREIDED